MEVKRQSWKCIVPGEKVTHLHAEKRFYALQKTVMTEAAVHARLSRDLYVALGEELPGPSWALRIYVKPFVRWIWLGGLLMALGGLIALLDPRYRRRQSAVMATAEVKSEA